MSNLDSIFERFTDEIRAHYRDEVLAKIASAPSKRTPVLTLVVGNPKRTPEAIDALTYELHRYVLQHPGQRVEQIGDGMGVTTKSLVIAVKRLAEKRLLVTKGQKRATAYWAK